jgi:hypothetical protein
MPADRYDPAPAYHCGICGCGAPTWTVTRRGDAAVSWACDAHLAATAHRLQRDWEVTELVVRLRPKAVEWAEIGQRLAAVTKDGDHG